MSYPDYPNNRLLVGGVDLSTKFKMVLLDGYVLGPPEPKTYTVDIPGGNGVLDLTEALLGEVTYKNRSHEFTFAVINASDFEKTKTLVSNFLHGKEFDYKITMDPEYTYHGRFTVSEYSHGMYSIGKVGTIKITIDARPFKFKDEQVYKVDAIGGKIVYFESGRLRVKPTIETDGFVKVISGNKLFRLPQGTWTINDILFEEGSNELYFNSYEIHNLVWKDLISNSVTWVDFNKKRLFEWYKTNGSGNVVNKTWEDLESNVWNDLSEQTWVDQMYKYEETSIIKNVYVKYDWGDL